MHAGVEVEAVEVGYSYSFARKKPGTGTPGSRRGQLIIIQNAGGRNPTVLGN